MKLKSYISQWMSVHCHLVGFIRKTMMLLCFGTLAFVYSGCAQVDLVDFWNLQGELVVEPDNSIHTLPAFEYYFYNADSKSDVIIESCDGANYIGSLPMGVYHTLAVCPKAQNTELVYMDTPETATIRVLQGDLDARSSESRFLFPGDVYVVAMKNMVVNPNKTAYYTPQPVLLTKYIQFSFALSQELKETLVQISGVLRGVCGSVQLFTCTPQAIEPNDAALHTTRFSASLTEGWHTTIPVLGIYDPSYGEVYTNTLSLTLNSSTNGTERFEVDLTKLFSDAIAGNKGELPATVPVEVKLFRTTIGIGGGATPWEESGGGEVVIPRP